MSKKFSYTIGFDLGGTKLAAALTRSDGRILDYRKIPVKMKLENSSSATQKRIVRTIADVAIEFRNSFPQYCSGSKFKGIGLASAGPLNVESGVLIHPVNFPGWKTVPIKKLVERALVQRGFKTNLFFQNDAMAAAFAEGWIGKAQKLKSYAVITIGTGIGSGIIVNGVPCQTSGAGSEFGHSIIDVKSLMQSPSKLSDFTVEGISSATGLIRRAQSLGFKGSSVEELIESKQYSYLFEEMACALAVLCFNLSIGFNLEAIFLSGGLIKIKDLYFRSTKNFYKMLIKQFNPMFSCSIQVAKTKSKAGVIGAAYLPYIDQKK
ncbi:MAG: ROK family protein [Pseudobdellovibrionaceae bacterium]